MGLFGSKKKRVGDDGLPAVPPRFAPEEVHTAYKEALQKDSLPPTQLPPDPQSLQQSPVQDSLSPTPQSPKNQSPDVVSKSSASSSPDFSSPPASLDDALANDDSQSDDSSQMPSGPAADSLSSPADMPVHVPEPIPSSSPDFPSQEGLPPEGEFPDAPTPEPDFSSSPASLDDALANDAPQSPASSDAVPPLADAPVTNYVPSPTTDYSAQTSQELPEDFPSVDVQSADDLSPIAPQEVQDSPPSQEVFDESKLPEIGVHVDKYTSNMASLSAENPSPAKFDSSAIPDDQGTQEPLPPVSSSSVSQVPDIAPPQAPADIPSSASSSSVSQVPDIAPPPTSPSTSTSSYNDFSEPSPPVSSSPNSQSSDSDKGISPVEERVILKHAVGTDVFVEKYVYEDVLLDVTGVQKDLQHAGSHLDKVMGDELAVTKKIDDWTKSLNTIQEKLMAVDICLFEKGDGQ